MQLNVDALLQALGPERGAAAKSLLKHPRVQDLIQEGGTYIYVARDQRAVASSTGERPRAKHIMLTGLTKFLQEFYWPAYSPFKKTQSAQIRAIKRVTAHRTALKKKAEERVARAKQRKKGLDGRAFVAAQEGARGHIRGSILHRQLANWVALDEQHFHIINPEGPHPSLTRLLNDLLKYKQIPIAVEYKVACTHLQVRLATGLDLLTVHGPTGRVSLIEIKTTQSRELFYAHEPAIPFTGRMARLAQQFNLKQSACTRAKIQLAMGVWMAIKGMGPSLKIDFDCYVILIPDSGPVDWIPVSDDFLMQVGQPLYEDLKQEIVAWREVKAKKKQLNKGKQKEEEKEESF